MLTDNRNVPLIIIVEDDYDHAELMKTSLHGAAEEYCLKIAASLHDARVTIEQHPPDIILTDYRLPDGMGSELVSTVNGLCPVILLTSQGNEQVAVNAMKAGAQDYVVKTSAVFAGISRIVQRGLREWALIQDQKRAKEEFHRIERHLLHVQKLESLGTMSGGIAHDFNNLLQAVLGNLELSLSKLPEDAPARNFICQAFNAAERAARLSKMMLAYSGRGFLNNGELNLTDLIEKNANISAAVISQNILFNLNLNRGLPLILADADQIQQVIMALLINSSESITTANGSIDLSTGVQDFDKKSLNNSRLEEKLAAGRYVWLEVSDSGCGMDVETRNKMFDPFFTTKFTGRGLGMSAVHGLIRSHKGAIMVDSSPGRGTTIRLLFPIINMPNYRVISDVEKE